MKKILSFILICGIALILIAAPLSSIFAISAPSSMSLISTNAYTNLVETGDMLFVVYGDIEYTSWPTDYTANDAYLVRLWNGTTELAATPLFTNPYYHYGYGKFISSLYFNSTDATNAGLVWGSAYTVTLEANPAISWNGTSPSPANVAVTWTGTGVGPRVVFIMSQLQQQWGVSLIDSGTLTSYGENYGISVIPYLRLFAPTIFSSYKVSPQYHERTSSLTYYITLRNQWVGTWFDLTTFANDMHIPVLWIYALLWLAFMTVVIFFFIEAPQLPQLINGQQLAMPPMAAKNVKMIFYLVILLVFFGGILGFLPWLAAILTGFVLIIMIVNQVFFQRSYA